MATSPVKQWKTPRERRAGIAKDGERIVRRPRGVWIMTGSAQLKATPDCARNTACCTSRGEKS